MVVIAWTFWILTVGGQMEQMRDAPIFSDLTACEMALRFERERQWRPNVVCWPASI